jgi:hypothetical protein
MAEGGVLTGPWGKGAERIRLAAIPLGSQQPKTRLASVQKSRSTQGEFSLISRGTKILGQANPGTVDSLSSARSSRLRLSAMLQSQNHLARNN